MGAGTLQATHQPPGPGLLVGEGRGAGEWIWRVDLEPLSRQAPGPPPPPMGNVGATTPCTCGAPAAEFTLEKLEHDETGPVKLLEEKDL